MMDGRGDIKVGFRQVGLWCSPAQTLVKVKASICMQKNQAWDHLNHSRGQQLPQHVRGMTQSTTILLEVTLLVKLSS